MNEGNTGLQMFLTLCVLLMVAAPLVSWSVIPERNENSSRLWFMGAVLLALVGIIYYLDQAAVTAYYVPNLGAGLFAVAALQRERRAGPAPWGLLFTIIAVAAVLHETGHRAALAGTIPEAWVLGPRVLAVTVLNFTIVVMALGLAREHRSRGMALVALGMAPLGLVNAVRVLGIIWGSDEMGPNADAGVFPVLAMLLTFTAVTYNFGFLAYALEKSHARSQRAIEQAARAEERATAAQAYSHELQDLIAQRDEMLMNTTRLSAVSAMGLYNAAIVHEISQPLQALRSVLDSLRLRLSRPGFDRLDELRGGVEQACELNAKASELIQSLRSLIASRPSNPDPIVLHEAILRVTPVLSGECSRRGITLSLRLIPQLDEVQVRAEPLLLQRMLMNLVANSIEALADAPLECKEIRLQTEIASFEGRAAVRLRIEDSGPGFPEALLRSDQSPLTTRKLDGVGLGLTLTRLVMGAWKGAVALGARDAPDRGARVDLFIPMA